MRIERFYDGGVAACCDSTSPAAIDFVRQELGDAELPLVVADPPYGNVVTEAWDRVDVTDDLFAAWMVGWTRGWASLLAPGGAFYVWGGIGRVGFRPFFKFLAAAEVQGEFELSTLITWAKKRAYGTKWNYLFTREELAYFVRGNARKPRLFNVPLLERRRGYAGYNPRYPAKSERYRRTNVWTDVTEIMRGKLHPTQKQQRVIEIPIEIHTSPGECVVDPFAGAGTTALACRKLGRRFIVLERDESHFDDLVRRLRSTEGPT